MGATACRCGPGWARSECDYLRGKCQCKKGASLSKFFYSTHCAKRKCPGRVMRGPSPAAVLAMVVVTTAKANASAHLASLATIVPSTSKCKTLPTSEFVSNLAC